MDTSSIQRAEQILRTPLVRPLPTDVLGLDFETVDKAARTLGYPVYPINDILELQRLAMPVAQLVLDSLLEKHEAERPNYYFIGRDAEMLFDALSAQSIGNSERLSRVRMVNHGMAVTGIKGAREYIAQAGIVRTALENGQRWVIVDSGFKGSIINVFLKRYLQIEPNSNLMKNISGYLVWALDDAWFPGISIKREARGSNEFIQKLWNRFAHSWNSGVTAGGNRYFDMSPIEKSLWSLCHWMQCQPKYFERAWEYRENNGIWSPLPDTKYRAYPNQNLRTVLDQPRTSSDSAIDPVAALKLQILTVNASLTHTHF